MYQGTVYQEEVSDKLLNTQSFTFHSLSRCLFGKYQLHFSEENSRVIVFAQAQRA